MKILRSVYIIIILSVFGFIAGCSSSTDWNSSFVVWDGYMYEVSDEYVDTADQEIGQVTKYSDVEGTYSGNFSNKYNKGTSFYSIKDTTTDEAIAIDVDGKFRKAINKGKYGKK